MEVYSCEKSAKFKRSERFFDINYVWVPGYRWLVKRLYYTGIRPEAVVILSLLCGLLSAYFYAAGHYGLTLIAALFILLKNFFDTVDGHLARAKGLESRLGRFLDSMADAVVYLFLFAGIAFNISEGNLSASTMLFSYMAMLAAFIQCSFYNYYVVSYKTYLKGAGLSRTDETFSEEERVLYQKDLAGLITFVLQWLYQWIYGWQDRLVTAIDKRAYRIFRRRHQALPEEAAEALWYADKAFLTLISPLCFGTQILALAIFTIFDNLEGYLIFLLTAWNLYAIAFFVLKICIPQRSEVA